MSQVAHKIPSFITPAIRARLAAQPPVAVADRNEMLEHITLLHPHRADGCYFLATKAGGSYREALHSTNKPLMGWELAQAQFVSMNRFMRRRTGKHIAAVGHVWLEFDYYGEDAQGRALPYRDLAPETVMAIIAAAIAEAGIPAPSFWTASGRGLHAVWVCEGLPGRAAPKVQRIMDALYGPILNADRSVPMCRGPGQYNEAQIQRLAPMWRVFRDAGLDQGTQDSARVLRLWGSVNPKNGELCRRLWPSRIEDIQSCRVDLLADALLPMTGDAYRKLMAKRAALPLRPDKLATKPKCLACTSKVGAWERNVQDLMRLREHRGRIAVGMRHLWVFLTANAMAHARSGDRELWAGLLAPLAGLSVAEARDCLGTLSRRAKRHQAGETVEHGGRVWSPLYNYSRAKMALLLGVTLAEANAAGLGVLRPGACIALTSTQRSALLRARAGAVSQDARAQAKVKAGHRALTMKAEGMTIADICAKIGAENGRGRTWVIEAMRDASATPSETQVVSAPEPQEAGFQAVRFSGRRSIGGSCPSVPPAPGVKIPAPFQPATASVPYAKPRVQRISAVSVRYDTAPGMGFTVIEDRLWGAVAYADDGSAFPIPEGLPVPATMARRKPPRPLRTGHRRILAQTRRAVIEPVLSADEYRRLTRGI